LAISGFNIDLVSRKAENLEKVKIEIAGIYRNHKVKVVQINLTNSTDYYPIT
jgi:short-subunit dehydrogenase